MRRLSPAILMLGFFAILIGLAAVFALRTYFARPVVAQTVAKPVVHKVVLASIDLPAGRVIRSSDMMNLTLSAQQYAQRKWPDYMLVDGRQILNRVLKQPIKKGESFSTDSFHAEGTGPDITQRLSPDHRAVQLSIPLAGIPSAMTPGSNVDVIFRSKVNKDASIPELTTVLLRMAEVIAIGDNTTPGMLGGTNPKLDQQSVVLALTPEQAMQLKVAEGHGELSLVLRNGSYATDLPHQNSLTLRELLELPPILKPAPPFVAEIYRRGRRETHTFDSQGILTGTDQQIPVPAPPAIPAPNLQNPEPALPDEKKPNPSAPPPANQKNNQVIQKSAVPRHFARSNFGINADNS